MKRPEQDLQISVVSWLSLAIDASSGFFWATPNETGTRGKRGMILGKIRKQMGVLSGMPDLIVAHKEVATPIGIELKSFKGTQTPQQKSIQARFKLMGWPYYICRTVDEVEHALRESGVPLRIKSLPFRGVIS